MFRPELLAEQNRLKEVHPAEKLCFTALCLAAALLFSRLVISLAVFGCLTLLLFLGMGITFKLYLKLLMLPLSFLLPGVVAVVLQSAPADSALLVFNFGGLSLGVTSGSIFTGINLLVRATACAFALYFLALSTPFPLLGQLLGKLGVPSFVVELATFTYRFIFVLAETAARIYTAQKARLGYSSLKRSFNSLGILAAGLLYRALYRSEMLYIAIQSRCYEGKMYFLEDSFILSPLNWLAMAIFFFILVCLHLIL